ncbi:hypothetical protein MES4922_30418 [Mesorhizobium ventifaucium]|uniref:Uncharacterized protein n=1 Tax=Mesorhizobium ventifaucium TaxID=666020 RepID=A0ABM9DZ20_9HYPH|nr:hypothetical protein MES4922_30418 [Mesorhizobium ventifaucium]
MLRSWTLRICFTEPSAFRPLQIKFKQPGVEFDRRYRKFTSSTLQAMGAAVPIMAFGVRQIRFTAQPCSAKLFPSDRVPRHHLNQFINPSKPLESQGSRTWLLAA